MIEMDKRDRFYYQKKGLLFFLLLVTFDILLFSFLFGKLSPYTEFFADIVIFLLSGPATEIFVGSKSLLRALPFMLAPLPFLLFVKTAPHFKIFIVLFLLYWGSWGILNFYLYVIS